MLSPRNQPPGQAPFTHDETLGSLQAAQPLLKVFCSDDGQGAVMQRIPVSRVAQTGACSIVHAAGRGSAHATGVAGAGAEAGAETGVDAGWLAAAGTCATGGVAVQAARSARVIASAAVRIDRAMAITGRPVSWVETRSENMVAMTQGRAQVQHVEMGFRRDGTITGVQSGLCLDANGEIVENHPYRNDVTGGYRLRLRVKQVDDRKCCGFAATTVADVATGSGLSNLSR